MTETYSGPRIFSIGRAFGRAIIILRRNIWVLGGLTTLAWGGLLIMELVVLVASAAGRAAQGSDAPSDGEGLGRMVLTTNLIGLFLLTGFVQALGCHGAACELEGRKARFQESLVVGLKAAFPAALLATVAMFAITLGSAFFVIPGIALGVLLGLVVPAYVVDGAGLTGAFSRSIALSENNRLRLLGYLSAANLALMAVTLVAAFALAALGNGMMSALGSGGRSMALLLSILAFAAYLLMFAVFGLAALAAGVIPASAWAEFVTIRGEGRKRADIASLFD